MLIKDQKSRRTSHLEAFPGDCFFGIVTCLPHS